MEEIMTVWGIKATTSIGTFVWFAIITTLILSVSMLLLFPLYRIFTLPSINYNEGWNAYRDQMAAFGYPLYVQKPRLLITNYPPLSFYIVGFFGRLSVNFIFTGRIIAIVSLGIISIIISAIIKHTTNLGRYAAFSALIYFVSIATFEPERIGMDDPDFLAISFSMLGLYAYIKKTSHPSWVYISALAICVGMFTKQDVISIPISIFIDLVLVQNWRALSVWLTTCLISTFCFLLLTILPNGPYFLDNILGERAYSFAYLINNISHYMNAFYAFFGICVLLIVSQTKFPFSALFRIFFLVSLFFAIVFSGGDGVDKNIFNEQIIAVVLFISASFSSISSTPSQRDALYLWFFFFIANILLFFSVLSRLDMDWKSAHELSDEIRAAKTTIDLLQHYPGPTVCEDLLLCFDAGKEDIFDTYYVKDQIMIGHLHEADIIAQIRSHYFSAIEIGNIEDPSSNLIGQQFRYTPNFLRSLNKNYRSIKINKTYTVYVPYK